MTGTPSFAAMVRELRRRAGLTMDELAAVSGVSARTISDMERGRSRRPQRRTVADLADALGLGPRQRAQLMAAASGRPLLPLPEPAEPFVGRDAELTRLRRLARQAVEERTAPVVVICGLGGVGKTALAVQAARDLADEFPGGLHFAVMSGSHTAGATRATRAHSAGTTETTRVLADTTHASAGNTHVPAGTTHTHPADTTHAPAGTTHAAAGTTHAHSAISYPADRGDGPESDLLRALGVPEVDIPADAEDRAGRYREAVRKRASLVVLDDAVDEAQVRPLLPVDGPVLTLVTSRRLLSGLEAVHRVHLGPLEPADAARLVDGEVAALCGFLPLALRVVAGRTPDDLATADRRLDRLAELGFPVEDVFARPYRALPSAAARALHRLARGEPVDDEDALEELVEAGLAEIGTGGSGYRLHELVRLFARRPPR
ncbi:helix-turn-helix domain-containing protein [Actinoplanes sp. CA-131856]